MPTDQPIPIDHNLMNDAMLQKLNDRTLNQKLYQEGLENVNGVKSQINGRILYQIEPMSDGVRNARQIFVMKRPETIGFSFDGQNLICSHGENKADFFKRFHSSDTAKTIFCSHKNCAKNHDEKFGLK